MKIAAPRTSYGQTLAGAVREAALALDASAKARRSALGLVAVLAYLLLGQRFAPGFTDYWGFHVVQTVVVLTALVAFEAATREDGGLAWPTHLLVVSTVVADTTGTAEGLYQSFALYDKIVHFASSAAFAAVAYEVLSALGRNGRIDLSPGHRLVVAVAASFLVAGLAWEFYEYLGDALFRTDRVQSRRDTMNDLISNICGAVLASAVLRAREMRRQGDKAARWYGEA